MGDRNSWDVAERVRAVDGILMGKSVGMGVSMEASSVTERHWEEHLRARESVGVRGQERNRWDAAERMRVIVECYCAYRRQTCGYGWGNVGWR